MLALTGSMPEAEKVARDLIFDDDRYLLDLNLLLAYQGRIQESWEVTQRALAASPDDDRVIYNAGWHSMLQGRLLEGFERMNMACPRATLVEALNRIEKAVRELSRQPLK